MRQPPSAFRTGSSMAASISTGRPTVAWLIIPGWELTCICRRILHDPQIDPQDAISTPPKLTLPERSKRTFKASSLVRQAVRQTFEGDDTK
jgi:hypothetical protein